MNRLRSHALTFLATATIVTVVALLTGWGTAVASQISGVLVTNGASQPVPVSGQAKLIPVGDGFTLAQGSDFESPFVDTSACSEIQALVEAHPGNEGTDVATLRTSTDGVHISTWPATYSDASPGRTLETFVFNHPTGLSLSDAAPTEPVVAPKASVHLNDASPASDRIDRVSIYCLP